MAPSYRIRLTGLLCPLTPLLLWIHKKHQNLAKVLGNPLSPGKPKELAFLFFNRGKPS